MTLERRIWHVGVTFTLLLLLVSCRMVYWHLALGPARWPDSLAAAADIDRDADENETAGTSVTATLAAVPTSTPAETPGQAFSPLATPGPAATRTKTSTPAATPMPTRTETPTPAATPTPTLDVAAIARGSIYDRNGRRLAYDIQDRASPGAPGEGGYPARFYTEPSLAHVVGYLSGLRVGVIGIEKTYDSTLLGLDQSARPVRGNDVYLTIDSYVQRAAAQALAGKAGAIVALDARTGAVLAMASSPAFDPNRILDPDYEGELAQCDGAVNCRQALFNRAAQGWYTPGSTWKTITLIAALETGQVTRETTFDFGSPLRDENGRIYYVYTVDGFSIVDPNHQEQRLDLARCFVVSANAAFARIGDEMPANVMIDYAARLGFSRPDGGAPPIEIDASAARLAVDPRSLATDNPLRASTAIGQGELLASPLSLALVVMAVVNDGDVPAPHLTRSIVDPAGRPLAQEPGGYWLRGTMRAETAALVRELMIQVVQIGSGARANLPGFVVGGKTGTAQVAGDAAPHSWFVGFVTSPAGEGVVIAVIVENGGAGSQAAAPLFAQVADAAMRHLGEPVEEIVPEPAAP
jgi:peptidoglycan glycosyltransferase